jgi:hypothetical protein
LQVAVGGEVEDLVAFNAQPQARDRLSESNDMLAWLGCHS